MARARGLRSLLPLLLVATLVAVPAGGDDVRPAVVGGTEAPMHRFRHQLGFYTGDALCGASLISPNVAVTAAHCVEGRTAAGMRVWAGGHNAWFGGDNDAAGYTVARALAHPGYDPDAYLNDIALLFLTHCAAVGDAVGTVAIATPEEVAAVSGSTWAVTGWGTTSIGADSYGQNGVLPFRLQLGEARLLPYANCSAAYAFDSVTVADGLTVCALGETSVDQLGVPRQDACQGDSGGPLTANLQAAARPQDGPPAADRLIGVVSDGLGCGLASFPTVYTYAPAYAAWIASEVEKANVTCTPSTTGPDNSTGGGSGALTLAYRWRLRHANASWAGRPIKSKALGSVEVAPNPDDYQLSQMPDRCGYTCAALRRCAGWSLRFQQSGRRKVVRRYTCDLFRSLGAACAPGDGAKQCRQPGVPVGAYEMFAAGWAF